jgi:hypothetical protein
MKNNMRQKSITISEEELKCLQDHLKPLIQLLSKLKKGADLVAAPTLKKKPETRKQGLSRMMKMIEERESRKLAK